MSKGYMLTFDLALRFAHEYANNINPERDSKLPQATKDKLMALSHKTIAANMMRNPEKRKYLICKLIIDHIEHQVLVPELMYGYNNVIDRRIKAGYEKLKEFKFGDATRAQVATNVAAANKELHQLPGFKEFNFRILNDKACDAWQLVRPLIYGTQPGVVPNEEAAWSAVYYLTAHTMNLAKEINASSSEFRMTWVKSKAKFMCDKMTPLNAQWDERLPTNLKDIGHDVVLGFSPQVDYREHRVGPNARMIVKAGVIIEPSNNATPRYEWQFG